MKDNEIRNDLKEIRYYYQRKSVFDDACVKVGHNAVLEKVQKYNQLMQSAPPRLYDLYISLYVLNFTQQALAAELNFSAEYVHQLNKRLLEFIKSKFEEKEVRK